MESRKEFIKTDLELTNKVMLAKALLKRNVNNYVDIVNAIFEKGLQNERYNINVISNPLDFDPCEGVDWLQHSWAGGREDKINIIPLLGDIIVGTKSFGEYSQNGSNSIELDKYISSDYTISMQQVCIEKLEGYDRFNGNDDEYINYTLHIYQPNMETLKQEKEKKLKALKVLGF